MSVRVEIVATLMLSERTGAVISATGSSLSDGSATPNQSSSVKVAFLLSRTVARTAWRPIAVAVNTVLNAASSVTGRPLMLKPVTV